MPTTKLANKPDWKLIQDLRKQVEEVDKLITELANRGIFINRADYLTSEDKG